MDPLTNVGFNSNKTFLQGSSAEYRALINKYVDMKNNGVTLKVPVGGGRVGNVTITNLELNPVLHSPLNFEWIQVLPKGKEVIENAIVKVNDVLKDLRERNVTKLRELENVINSRGSGIEIQSLAYAKSSAVLQLHELYLEIAQLRVDELNGKTASKLTHDIDMEVAAAEKLMLSEINSPEDAKHEIQVINEQKKDLRKSLRKLKNVIASEQALGIIPSNIQELLKEERKARLEIVKLRNEKAALKKGDTFGLGPSPVRE
ncbi:MAG: hypothetical protein H0W88_08525 [Parachlamydiaceae bacterium]|nr:hypothetical protein [Parachlamydiaceae bacterium]